MPCSWQSARSLASGGGRGGEPVQGLLLRIGQECQKVQVTPQGMAGGKEPEAICALREQVPSGKGEETDLAERVFDPARLQDAVFGAHLRPPVISRNHAG